MPKMKTNKSIAKRYKLTKTGKIIKRTAGQAHFNQKETGKVGRNKRSDVLVSRTLRHFIEVALPKG